MRQAHVFISGEVQDIGFRSFVRWQAKKLNLTGWVRNVPDGRVEAVLEGEEKNLQEIIKACHEGPPLSRVEDVDVSWLEGTGEFSGFAVK